jgi:hypothetical protein
VSRGLHPTVCLWMWASMYIRQPVGPMDLPIVAPLCEEVLDKGAIITAMDHGKMDLGPTMPAKSVFESNRLC